MTNNKGITLIALVITIIVLLILAGVSIAMLTGENGILNQADRAGDETNRAEVLERVNMELNGQLANSISANADDIIIIKATSGKYPWFGSTSTGGMDYIKSIEGPFPLMHQADGNPITSLNFCFYLDCSLSALFCYCCFH